MNGGRGWAGEALGDRHSGGDRWGRDGGPAGDPPVGRHERSRPAVPGAVRADLGLDYDFFLLFDPTASWGSAPPRPLSAGATVIGENKRLARDIAPLLG
jgi:hypothetical protein